MPKPWEKYGTQETSQKPWERYGAVATPAPQVAQQAPQTATPPADQGVVGGVPQWGRENPNLYGAAGAVKEIGSTLADTASLAGQAAINLPGSTVNLLNQVGQMFASPMETLQTLGDVAFGGVRKATGLPLGDEEKFEAVTGHFKEKYGSREGLNKAIAEDPASVLLDASVLMTGGGSLAAKVPQIAKAGEAVAAAGRAVDPLQVVGKAASGAAKGLDRAVTTVAEEALGASTGAGPGAIRQALQADQSFVKAMRGGSSGEEVLGVAKDALGEIKQANADLYRGRLAEIAGDTRNIDTRPIKGKLQKLLDSRNVKVGADGGLDFSRSTIGKNGIADVEEITQLVSEWGTKQGDNTAIGLDILKRRLDDFYSESKASRSLVADLRNTVKNEIVKSVPEYKQMVGDYESMAKFTNEVERSLSLNNKAMMDTAIRKLMSSPRETFKFRNQLLKQMDDMTSGELSNQIAGVSMQEALPKGPLGKLYAGGVVAGGAGSMSPPILMGMAATASPRVMGELLSKLGYTRKQAGKFMSAAKSSVKGVPSVARGGLMELGEVTGNQNYSTSLAP